jgi:AraC-like DNA-binding protein
VTEPRRFHVATRDADMAHDWLRRAYTDHTVTLSGSPKSFHFKHDVLDCGPYKIGVCRHSMNLQGRWAPLGDQLLVSHLLEGRFQIGCRQSDVAAGPGDTFAYDPDVAMDCTWSDILMAQIRLDRPAVERVLAEFGDGGQSRAVTFELARPLTPARGRRWMRLMRFVQAEAEAPDSPQVYPLVARQTFRLIVATLLETFPHATPDGPRPAGHASGRVVRRATAFMDEHAAEDVDLIMIADAVQVSPRALQRAFRRTMETTPLEHLRSVRLQRAHEDLEAADPTSGATVAGIAARWGFGHPGRFATAYRARFGRSPSDTLRS